MFYNSYNKKVDNPSKPSKPSKPAEQVQTGGQHRYKIACNDCLSCINADRNVRLF